MPEMGIDRDRAAAFVEAYGRAWEEWDFAGFAELFSDDVVYVAHATEKTVVGQAELAAIFGRRLPIRGEDWTTAGCLIADLRVWPAVQPQGVGRGLTLGLVGLDGTATAACV